MKSKMYVLMITGLGPPQLYYQEKKHFLFLSERKLSKLIPMFADLSEKAKVRKLDRWLKSEDVEFHSVKVNALLPNACKVEPNGMGPPCHGCQTFLNGSGVFEQSAAGYTILADILCAMHLTALQEAEPGFHPAVSISSSRPEIAEILETVVHAAAPRSRWKNKRCSIRREATLYFDVRSGHGFSPHIQDFSRFKIKRHHAKLMHPLPYQDTVLLVVNANSSQVREITPYIEHAAVILLNSSSGELAPTKLPSASIAAYDPDILKQMQKESLHIAALMRWWWGDALADEDTWAQEIVRKARASLGKPDSRYVRVEFDPKRLRDAIRYQVWLSFLDMLELKHMMAPDELAPYRQGAKDVFDPAPPEPVAVRHAEDPDVFLEVMCEMVQNSPGRIVPEDERYVRADKPLAAWRTIGQTRYLVFEEDVWAKAYVKAVRAKKDIDCSLFQCRGRGPEWVVELHAKMCQEGLVKGTKDGHRYRYDLLKNGSRDSTYVIAIPAHLFSE